MIFRQQVDQFVKGHSVENAHPAIVMFSMSANMKFAHLPVAGGIYDQDPELLRRWRMIWQAQAVHEKAEQDRRDRARKQKSARRR